MAGLIASAEIMIGGRTPHPYHTRPGMVSQSNDGDPHGKPPRRYRAGTGSAPRGNRFAKRAASAASGLHGVLVTGPPTSAWLDASTLKGRRSPNVRRVVFGVGAP